MTISRWLPSFAPVTTITIAAILALSLAVLSTMLALSGPWLGVVFDRSYDGAGVRVEQVMGNSSALGKLHAGDIINAFVTSSSLRAEVSPVATLEDPDQLASYAEFNSFFALQQVLWDIISSPSFSVILGDGRKIELTHKDYPGLGALPATFWSLLLFGGASFLLGVSVWSLRSSEPVTRVLAISGIGFMLGAYSCAIYMARELALPSSFFFALESANHLGIIVFAYSSILFFWYYPKKLGNAPAAWIFVAGVVSLWLNETLQWWSWPAHVYYAHFVVAYCLLLLFTVQQWRKSRGAPLERAMLKWLLATMLLSLGFTIALFYVPIILTGKPIASTVITFGAVFALYVGLIIGIVRYHQFDMQYWWLTAWQWLIFVLIALLADSLFFYFLHLTDAASVGLAIAVGGIYLMVRQWFWGRYSGSSNRALDHALPHLVDALILQQQKSSPKQQWRHLLERVFNPLSVKAIPEQRDSVIIERSGLALLLPDLDGLTTIEVFCCNRGKRLFVPTDVNLARRLLELMRHSQDVITARDVTMAREQGAQEERHRIQRDLHDDVAARLLSLIHQTREPVISKVARSALRGLRDVIHLLGAEEMLLEDVITDIEAGVREQLAGLDVQLEWHSAASLPTVMLSSQQQINLQRIAREAISNALKHAHPEHIAIRIDLESNELCLRVSNDGAITEISGWIPGRGVNNIKYRVAEMGGSHKWGIEQLDANRQYCCLAVCVPLSLV
jgi:signal transduction histidine kinase